MITPCLVVGLGEFGVLSLEKLKTILSYSEDKFSRVELLGVDFISSGKGTEHLLGLNGYDVREVLKNLPGWKDALPWFPPLPGARFENELDPSGVAGCRLLGHLAGYLTGALIEDYAKDRISRLRKYSRNGVVKVCLISSLSGGTGSGLLADATFLIHRIAGNCPRFAYLMMPKRRMPGWQEKFAKAYACLKEIHNFKLQNLPFEMTYKGGGEIKLSREDVDPFQRIFLFEEGIDDATALVEPAEAVAGVIAASLHEEIGALVEERNKSNVWLRTAGKSDHVGHHFCACGAWSLNTSVVMISEEEAIPEGEAIASVSGGGEDSDEVAGQPGGPTDRRTSTTRPQEISKRLQEVRAGLDDADGSILPKVEEELRILECELLPPGNTDGRELRQGRFSVWRNFINDLSSFWDKKVGERDLDGLRDELLRLRALCDNENLSKNGMLIRSDFRENLVQRIATALQLAQILDSEALAPAEDRHSRESQQPVVGNRPSSKENASSPESNATGFHEVEGVVTKEWQKLLAEIDDALSQSSRTLFSGKSDIAHRQNSFLLLPKEIPELLREIIVGKVRAQVALGGFRVIDSQRQDIWFYHEQLFRSPLDIMDLAEYERAYKSFPDIELLHIDVRFLSNPQFRDLGAAEAANVFCGNPDCDRNVAELPRSTVVCPHCNRLIRTRCGNANCLIDDLDQRPGGDQDRKCPACGGFNHAAWWICRLHGKVEVPVPRDKRACPVCIKRHQEDPNRYPERGIGRRPSLEEPVPCPRCQDLANDDPEHEIFWIPTSLQRFVFEGVPEGQSARAQGLAQKYGLPEGYRCPSSKCGTVLIPVFLPSKRSGTVESLLPDFAKRFLHPKSEGTVAKGDQEPGADRPAD